jgi:preprotein translocase subunit SecD
MSKKGWSLKRVLLSGLVGFLIVYGASLLYYGFTTEIVTTFDQFMQEEYLMNGSLSLLSGGVLAYFVFFKGKAD